MDPVPFVKMSGCGNDFILIDNRSGIFGKDDPTAFVRDVCRRKMSVGADGLILIEKADAADFKWRFYNSDGSRAEMCGNGARCAARFAHEKGVAGKRMVFLTDAGEIDAEIRGTGVKIRMTDPSAIGEAVLPDSGGGSLIVRVVNTGVPHAVISVPDETAVDLKNLGPQIRFHPHFAPAGTNVNVMSRAENDVVFVRTYERGVEDETLACGTGVVACVLVFARDTGVNGPVRAKTRSGGTLTVHFERQGDRFERVYLEGDARMICRGEILKDACGYETAGTQALGGERIVSAGNPGKFADA